VLQGVVFGRERSSLVKNCTVDSVGGVGIFLRSRADVESVIGNMVTNTGSGGIVADTLSSVWQFVSNNTVLGAHGPGISIPAMTRHLIEAPQRVSGNVVGRNRGDGLVVQLANTNLQGINGAVTVLNGGGLTSLTVDDSADLARRIATVGADGTPHVVPVGWIYNAARETIDVGGYELQRSKKFRDVARTGRAAIVIDDLESTEPWRPRAIEVRGRAEAIALPTPLIRIHPERIVSWGLEQGRSARTVRSPR